VEELHVFGSDLTFDLSSVPKSCLHTLDFIDVTRLHFYAVLKVLGGDISHLSLKMKSSSQTRLNLLTVFTKCPKIQHLEIESFGSLKREITDRLTASHFKNLTQLVLIGAYHFLSLNSLLLLQPEHLPKSK